MNAIVTDALSKVFNGTAAVDGINLQVPEGSIFGFLGPNGSGKTTTTRMLLGLMRPTAGSVELLGRRMPEHSLKVLPRVGALVEGPAFYPFLTGARNLSRLDAAEGADRAGRAARIAAALDRVGLTGAAGKRYRQYSLGMKQRLALAAALLRPRDLLVLDEPTNGLDPQGTREVRQLIRTLATEGTTVFLSSHLLSEVEQLCSHVAVLSLGKILAQGSLAELQSTTAKNTRLIVSDPVEARRIIEERPAFGPVRVDGDTVTVQLRGGRPEDLNRLLVQAGVDVRELSTRQPSLEDLFVSLTGENFDVA
ncbi:MAG: ABC transporter ATP-binding protein [Actinomycetota bacterium]|nr:ABC transporter ATP-binding protein [Actinomycetota bacterium]